MKNVTKKKVLSLINSFERLLVKYRVELVRSGNESLIHNMEHLICVYIAVDDYQHLYRQLRGIYRALCIDLGLTNHDLYL